MTTLPDVRAAISAAIGIDDCCVVLERGPHYIQLLFDQRDGVVVEAVSNGFLDGEATLWPAQERKLADLGWRAPVTKCDDEACTEGTHPNWWRYVAAPIDATALTAVLADTMISVYLADLPSVSLECNQLG